ncbi:bifunctional adenosylcobinamide kinase/adenosylcobinamide-phosphate guanylyltransferase [Pseudoalteromonas sp. SSM20]|uniref:bifunctional adenosylcobinamide kinase/adenosylcobinamide-phosphate guanylyltransferase n=1 Tax=Pseudoalteromonas sp. SSM20 TaxID=3139394 RepID=UPI003BAA32D7
MNKYLVIGGVRSGKSRHAEKLAEQFAQEQNANVIYVATAEAFDDEMTKRIEHHKDARPVHWQTRESGPKLTHTLAKIDNKAVILIDCLTVWLNNCLYYEEIDWQSEKALFLEWLQHTEQTVIMVTNEVGFSITPDNTLARQFADEQGWLNQAVAAISNNVTFTIAGIPYELKKD